jgi:signal transduction histidine kinase
LKEATQRMEGGNLSVRVALPGARSAAEFQALAVSFNGMAQRVEGTVSTLQAFVADAAHELHTPLTALHTNLELASGEGDPARCALHLERARDQELRLETLVNGLLDLSRIEASSTSTRKEQVDLNLLLAGLGEQFASRAEQAERTFQISLPQECVHVCGDPQQLQRILVNLLENSLKFTHRGGTISLELVRKGDEAVLVISDDGIGIPAEDLPHLFERFHRGRNVSSYPGSGLGLAITRALVNANGGTIQAEPASGVGTRMVARFPAVS